MIKSIEDYKAYIEADKTALGRKRRYPKITDYIWKYEILLRKCEYYNNCRHGWLNKLWEGILRYRRSKIGAMCGFSITINCVEKGLCLSHIGPIIINPYARIGMNCRLHVGVNIGADARIAENAPIIGNNVYIGPGAKIFGKISIANNIAIGANAVVNKSFLEENISIGGIPAKKISGIGTKGILF